MKYTLSAMNAFCFIFNYFDKISLPNGSYPQKSRDNYPLKFNYPQKVNYPQKSRYICFPKVNYLQRG